MRRVIGAVAVGCAFIATGCGDGDSADAPAERTPSSRAVVAADATTRAGELEAEVSSVQKVVTITETNDPNNLIGRPNGYRSAAVLYDSGTSCDDLGSDCGAAVEVFEDEAAATSRGEYIQGVLAETPALGSEWTAVDGAALLRVNGELKPSVARRYFEAFGGDEVTVPTG